MGYAKIMGYSYVDRDDGYTLISGTDPTGRFLHQVIEDPSMDISDGLEGAINAENDGTMEYAGESGVKLDYGEPAEITIDGCKHLLMYQEMSFEDGRKAVQENAYFFDPEDGMFRIVQFGTLPMTEKEWTENSDKYRSYTSSALRKLLLASTDERFAFKIKPFSI